MRTSRFKALPAELADAILLQPAHAARHSALLATGRVWKTHVVSSSRPDQVSDRVRLRPGAGAGLDLEDVRRHRVDCHSHRPGCQKV